MNVFNIEKDEGNIFINNTTIRVGDFIKEDLFFENLVEKFDFYFDMMNNRSRYRIEVIFCGKKYYLYFIFSNGLLFSLSAVLIGFCEGVYNEYDHDGNLKLIVLDFKYVYEKEEDEIDDLGFTYFEFDWGVTKIYYESLSSMVFWSIKWK
ncbi:hypothetical protein [Acinetobacter johnsonii]|jgi:hypothetical protein|uniref:Uncharacterized protein n=1 Tax=Acinetobacter johnsonii TaxID=40214 RepID=A0A3Q8XEW6_ACIJO|nr:hypothetical protein [Acinetobacter johnsonii]AZN64952.1 hypothetical protein CFH90_13325 [Acinetobacter johnsonii]MCF7642658.1 hypothetical protein [Acinetobacter johnsonii]